MSVDDLYIIIGQKEAMILQLIRKIKELEAEKPKEE